MKKRLIVNTALLTGASLLMRCIGMVFQAWLAGRIGAAGIGLYQLVMSVEVLATTFAISGIRFAATRLVAEEIGLGRGSGVGGAMYRCAAYSLIFGAAACGILYIFAEPDRFSLDRRREDGHEPQDTVLWAAVHCAVVGAVRLFHGLRADMETLAGAFARAAHMRRTGGHLPQQSA